MGDKMNKTPDLTQDWPNESDNGELVLLAEELANAAPALSEPALARVAVQMRVEMERASRQRSWRRVAFGLSTAAAVVLAVAGVVYFQAGNDFKPQPRVVKLVEPAAPVVIEDRVAITISESTPPAAPAKALVRLEEYRSLFSD